MNCADCGYLSDDLQDENPEGDLICDGCTDNYIGCSDCFSLVDINSTSDNNEGCPVCEDCSEDYGDCGDCGIIIRKDESLSSNEQGSLVCDNCCDNYCIDELNDKTILAEESVEAEHIRFGCPTTIITHIDNCQLIRGFYYTSEGEAFWFNECNRCGVQTHREDAYYDNYGNSFCEGCMPTDVVTYDEGSNINPDDTTYNDCKFRRSYGVELEYADAAECSVDNRENPYRGRFGCKYDGSIDCEDDRGAEFFSPILYGDAGFNAIDNFCSCTYDCDPNETCGFHLHIGIADLNEFQRCQLVRATTLIENVARMLVPADRSENSYCCEWSDCDPEQPHYDFEAIINRERYSAFNYRAWDYHKTLEVRLHHSTTNRKEIKNWISLWLALVDYIANDGSLERFKGTDQRVFNNLTALAGREVAEYYADRAEAYGYNDCISREYVTLRNDCIGQKMLQFA